MTRDARITINCRRLFIIACAVRRQRVIGERLENDLINQIIHWCSTQTVHQTLVVLLSSHCAVRNKRVM